jgi:hypothetical protein
MITRGFDKPLYTLPFDHRGSFETEAVRGEVELPGNMELSAAVFGPRLGLEYTYKSKKLR